AAKDRGEEASTGCDSKLGRPSMTMLTHARLQRALANDATRRSSPVTVAPVESATPAPDSAPAPMLGGPLRLTDDQLTAVLRAATPLATGDRDAFLRDVAAALQ